DYSTLTNLPSIPSLEGLATKDDLDSKADLNHTHSEYLTELPEHTHDYSTLTNLPSIPSLEGLATVSYVNQAIADLIKDYGLTLTSDPDSNPDPTPDPTPDSTDDKSYEGNGTKYYVSPKGNNSNSGTSIDKPFQTINAALSKAVGGDIIYLRDGTYNEDITLTRSGSLGNYITIRNYPGETPILDRQSTGIIGIDLGKTSYININGLEICNLKQPQKNGTAAIGIYKEEGGSHIVIQNCTFHDINAYSSTGGDGNWASAIKLVGVTSTKISNVIIKNNLIYNCILGWNEALAIESNIEYVDILNNTIHDVTNIGIDIAGNFGECSTKSLDQARYINLIGNIVYNCISPYATCAGLYVDGARDVLIERNISYGNMTGIEVGAEMSVTSYPVKNITVRNNLIYGNTEYGIMCGGYYSGAGNVQDTHFYNNTVIHGGSNTTIEMSKSQNIDFVNNIFYCTNSNNITDHDSSLTSSMSNITFNYNNFYSTKNTSPSSTIAQIMGKEYTNTTLKSTFNSNQTLTNPQFTSISSNDYTLSSNSACINAGTSSNIEVGEQDLIGNNRISGSSIDMGCYEI
ncbi:right-handed parallel beta-helix repeat-containing protein, partial [Turicibacter sanguinis]